MLYQVHPSNLHTILLKLFTKNNEKKNFQTRRKVTTPLKIIDSSTLPLNLTNHKWAEFRKTKAGVKLHLRLVFMERGLSYPDQAVITEDRKSTRLNSSHVAISYAVFSLKKKT